jgi:hypothetical protein
MSNVQVMNIKGGFQSSDVQVVERKRKHGIKAACSFLTLQKAKPVDKRLPMFCKK